MRFKVIDSEAAYRAMLAESDTTAREAIFRRELAQPFAPLSRIFGGSDPVQMMAQWSMFTHAEAGNGKADALRKMVETLTAHNGWAQAAQALEDAKRAFAPYAQQIALDEIVFALLFTDVSRTMPTDRGYAGFGGFPGYIMVTLSEVNDYTLPRIKGATAHELHHNIRFTLFPFNPMETTVEDYIIAEGLAESFAKELYGAEVVGFMITEFDESRYADTKRIIGDALDVRGFNEVRGYIFGDVIAELMNFPKTGVPGFAGYRIGFDVVQAFCARTGKSVVEATLLPAREIIAASGFFD